MSSGRYLSLAHCKSPTTFISDFSVNKFLPNYLSQMGFTLIDTTQLLKDVRSSLNAEPLEVETVLSKLLNHQSDVASLFSLLDSVSCDRFVSWIRADLSRRDKNFFSGNGRYRKLPLWRSATDSFVSANEALMLPRYITVKSIAPFTSVTVTDYASILVNMGLEPPSSIHTILDIPARLGEDMDGPYKHLIRALLDQPQKRDNAIPVPNSNRQIQDSNTLYSSRDDLFLAAFGSDSQRFIHPTFREFEEALEKFGLKRQRPLTIGMFRDCVTVFETTRDQLDRAAIIFQIFAEDLPLHAHLSSEHEWKTLDDLNFVPRNVSPRPLPGINALRYIDKSVRFLPDVVSPSKLVREEYMAISWSQRALYNTEPHQRVLLTYPGLSVPTVADVVSPAHLSIYLGEIAETLLGQASHRACSRCGKGLS
jgi:sacsin